MGVRLACKSNKEALNSFIQVISIAASAKGVSQSKLEQYKVRVLNDIDLSKPIKRMVVLNKAIEFSHAVGVETNIIFVELKAIEK